MRIAAAQRNQDFAGEVRGCSRPVFPWHKLAAQKRVLGTEQRNYIAAEMITKGCGVEILVQQDRCAMKVTTDACLFGAWAAERVGSCESGVGRILDIGTGTGLLTLMMAQKTRAFVDTIEIDKDAFEQARENIAASPWKEKINIYRGGAGEFSFPSKYDAIISNPPFYENELRSPDEKKNLALHGGLSLQDLLSIIRENLTEKGSFFLLLPYKRDTEIDKAIHANQLSIRKKILVRQSAKHHYFRIMIEGTNKPARQTTITNEINIWNDQQQYTKEFTALLKDYYLYL